MDKFKNRIRSIAKNIGIDLIGFTSAKDFENIRPYIDVRAKKGFLSGFEEEDIERRLDPLKAFPKAKSIISIGMSYNYKVDKQSNGKLSGVLSKSAWGKDYHKVVYGKLEELMEEVNIKNPMPIEYIAFVDTGPLSDRAIAHRAGIGSYGKNGFIINPQYGSWIFLGSILVDKLIEEDQPLKGDICKSCDLCIKTCPTGALKGPFLFNAKKCISFLTQKKEILNIDEEGDIGKNIYGCDICQKVCPLNKGVKWSNNQDFKPKSSLAFPILEDVIKMTNKEFQEGFKTTSAGWRGKKILQRNAIIGLGNSRDKKSIPILEKCLKDSRWEIRFYTIRALYKFGENGKEIIKEWFNNEEDIQVRKEIELLLYKMES